jgi:triosephosphate isomerase
MGLKPLIAGNWKMFGRRADLGEIRAMAAAAAGRPDIDVVICPPALLLAAAVEAAGSALMIGGQDCRPGPDAAATGDVNAGMLVDAGAQWCIVGHSERRQAHGETSEHVRDKAASLIAAGVKPIICVGETLVERKAGRAALVVAAQVRASVPPDAPTDAVIAYEPVWAIGTGLTPSAEEIIEIHSIARGSAPAAMRVVYGGSVKATNAREILALPGVSGALVGGASLRAADFGAILAACPAAAGR